MLLVADINIKKYKSTSQKRRELGFCADCGKIKTGKSYRCNNCAKIIHIKREKKSCLVFFKECIVCGKNLTARRRNVICCSRKCVSIAYKYGKGVRVEWRPCQECGNLIKTYSKNKYRKYCSYKCKSSFIDRNNKHKRRLIKKNAFVEYINVRELFERDNSRCQLCNKKLNLKRKVPNLMAATIDHITPLSKGGEHSYRNTQLACYHCNSVKGNRGWPGGEQLRMFG